MILPSALFNIPLWKLRVVLYLFVFAIVAIFVHHGINDAPKVPDNPHPCPNGTAVIIFPDRNPDDIPPVMCIEEFEQLMELLND